MASPQPDRFVRVSTELLEAFVVARLSGVQFQIVLWTIRHTFGWNRKSTKFSWYRIAKDIGQDRGNVFRAGQRLLRANILQLTGREVGIQKDYDRWQRPPSTPMSVDNEKRCQETSMPMSTDIGGRCQETSGAMSVDNESDVVGQRNRCQETSVFIGAKDSIDIDKDISIDTKGASDSPVASHPQTQPPEAPLKGGPFGGGCIDEASTGKKEEKDPAVVVMNAYLSVKGQRLDAGKLEGFYKQFRNEARGLLDACDGDVKAAVAAVSRIGSELIRKRLSWSLSTVRRWFSDPSLMEGGDNHRGGHSAGAATPIPRKYAHLSKS